MKSRSIIAPAARSQVEVLDNSRPDPATVRSCAASIRNALRLPIARDRIAHTLSTACVRWRERSFPARRDAVAAIASGLGWSVALLAESLDASLKPFDAAAFASLAPRLAERRELFGFVMPGNVPGAGLHELCQVMLAGGGALVKTSSAEPRFFATFAQSLREIDEQVGARIAVLNWGRERTDLTAALTQACDCMVVLGDDETLANLAGDTPQIGFGSRVSAVAVADDCAVEAVARALARDVSLFEQRGCLSPHHIFVEEREAGFARSLARQLARALDDLAVRLAPGRLGLTEAAAIRSARENARWARIGGRDVELWEGESMRWTVIYDRDAHFSLSPGGRTAYVTPFRDVADLRVRLASVAGRLEAFALADPAMRLAAVRKFLTSLGVSYMPAPGAMQSPPLDWPHGGGALLAKLGIVTRPIP